MTSEKELSHMPRALNREKSATMCDSSNDAGDLSLFCSVSSVESEESQVSEVEDDLEIVEPYQFEPVASDSPAESDTEAQDDGSGDEERFCSRDL